MRRSYCYSACNLFKWVQVKNASFVSAVVVCCRCHRESRPQGGGWVAHCSDLGHVVRRCFGSRHQLVRALRFQIFRGFNETNHERSSLIAAQTSDIFSYFGSHDWSAALASCRSKNTIQVATHGGKLHCWSGTILSSRTVHPAGVFSSGTSASLFCRPDSPHHIPRCHGATAQKCSFSVVCPSTWNRLPTTLREAVVQLPRGSFKKDFKTYLSIS